MAEMTPETVILEFGTPDNVSNHVSAFLIAAELGNFIDSRAAWETALVVNNLMARNLECRAAVQAEHERTKEACAKVADAYERKHMFGDGTKTIGSIHANKIAAAIRAMPEHGAERGKEEG